MSEHYSMWDPADVAAVTLGAGPLRPDEVLMAAEESTVEAGAERDLMTRRVACVCGLLQAMTAQAADIQEVRDRVLVLAEMACPGLLPRDRQWHGAGEKARLAAVRGRLLASGLDWEPVAGEQLLRLVTLRGWEAYDVARRVLCLLYAVTPDKSLRPPMAQSLGKIGEALGLRASNPRSGPSAAVKAVVGELLAAMQRCDRAATQGKLWFQKSADCKARLRESMLGKTNRRKKTGEP